ncbi:hypothetical protein SCALM49S_07247 [Streptomyces californicus]
MARSPRAPSSLATASSFVPPPMSTPSTVVPLGTSAWFSRRPAPYAMPSSTTAATPSRTSLERPFLAGAGAGSGAGRCAAGRGAAGPDPGPPGTPGPPAPGPPGVRGPPGNVERGSPEITGMPLVSVSPETWPPGSGAGACGVRIAVSSDIRGGCAPGPPGAIGPVPGPGPAMSGTPSRFGVSEDVPVTGPVVGPDGPGIRGPPPGRSAP